MKPKERLALIGIATIFSLSVIGLLGCGGKIISRFSSQAEIQAEIDARLVRVRTAPPRRVVDFQEAQQYEDERILAHWDIRSEGMFFMIENKGQTDALKILWEEVVIADVNQFTYDVESLITPKRIPEGAKVAVGLSREQADDRNLIGHYGGHYEKDYERGYQKVEIAHGTIHYTVRIPHSIFLTGSTMDRTYGKETQKWINAQLQAFKQEVESYDGRTFDVLIPMLDAGKEIEYLFTFRLQMSIKEEQPPTPPTESNGK